MTIHHKLEGTPNSPVLVFSNSLGADMTMWDEVTHLLLPYFRVLRYNTGMTGIASDIPTLGQEVITLLNHYRIASAHFCGLSMGGLIGQWLAIHHPERIDKLILANTAAKIGTPERWNDRIETVAHGGVEAIFDATMKIWFTDAFFGKHPERGEAMKAMFLGSDKAVYLRNCAAIRDADFREQLGKIKSETLVVTGADDPITTVEHAGFLVKNIPAASLKVLPVRHLSAAEIPEDFAETLLDFLVGTETRDRGMHVRRTVLGNDHVDRAIANLNEFNTDFQNFITQYAWGDTWTRPGLSKRERSLITVAMLIALNRKPEFQLHIRGALSNGVTVEEIKELILQSAIYCGVPAANEAFHAAAEIIKNSKQ